MTRKFSKIIICLIAALCMFCNSLTTFAIDSDLDFDFNIQPEVPTTLEETVPVETEKPTEKETEKPTEKETTEKPTKRPASPQTTKREEEPRPDNDWDNNANANVQVNAQTTKKETTTEETTDENLKKGEFYVYLERNNGQRRLRTLMKKKGYVPEPEIPVREGYTFSGWYSDAKFKKPWNFLIDKAEKGMTIYAKWTANGSAVVYDITVKDAVGGVLEVNPQSATMGEPIVITVIPDEGKRLVQGSVMVNGEPTDFLSFIMPESNVTISASFEDIPESEEDKEKSGLPFFIVSGVVVIIILVIVIVITKKRRDFNADLDPNEDLQPDTEEYYDDWVDETIVVEDGFKEGKKVVENTEPDYGAPDLDEDDSD